MTTVRRAGSGGEDAALAAIVRSSQDAVIAKTARGVVTAWNTGAEVLYGHTASDMIGRNIDLTFTPEAMDLERRRHHLVAQGLPESGFRCVRLRADGRRVEVVMSMLPVRDEHGTVVGLASISRPVNEEERAQERFGALLDAAPDAIVCVDPAGRVTVGNARGEDLFGHRREELLGMPVELLVPALLEERQGRHSDNDPRAVAPPDPGLALTGRRRDGSTFPVEVSLATTGHGADELVIASVRDVTDEHAVQASLRESMVRLQQLAENMTTVFTLRQIDPPRYLYISPGFEVLTGYSAEEVQDEPVVVFERLIHPEDRAAARLRLERPDGKGGAEYRIVRKDGRIRWVRTVVNGVPNPSGSLERVVGMTEDITDRVLADQRLAAAELEARAANDAKNGFLSRVSHELRTPLNAVLGFAQLLEIDLSGTHQEESVGHVLRAGRHLLGLIDDVLDISRIEAGELAVSLEPISVPSMVGEACSVMAPIADAARVTLHLDGATGACWAQADSQRLRQILLNLITNAVKYNRPGGQVRLSWQTRGEEVVVAVSDDGPGIPVELRGRLFTPFDRLGAEATTVQGSGVGLAVSRSLAELMHGTVRFAPRGGNGSVFTVTLPKAWTNALDTAAHATSATDLPSVVTGPEQGSRTVLYVEDNLVNAQLIESVLGLRPGWRLLHTTLGSHGIDLALTHQPDLILLDLQLPDLSGIEVLQALKATTATAQIPVAVLSADANPSSVLALTSAGAIRYLTKPLQLPAVLTLLDEHVHE